MRLTVNVCVRVYLTHMQLDVLLQACAILEPVCIAGTFEAQPLLSFLSMLLVVV